MAALPSPSPENQALRAAKEADELHPVHAQLHRVWTKAVDAADYVKAEWMELEGSIMSLVRRADPLIADPIPALRPYLQHKPECPRSINVKLDFGPGWVTKSEVKPCSCGFDALVDALPSPPPEKWQENLTVPQAAGHLEAIADWLVRVNYPDEAAYARAIAATLRQDSPRQEG